MATLNKLNAKSIKKALKMYDVKVLRCAQCKGSAKNAINIVVDSTDGQKTVSFFNEFGIVNKGNVTPPLYNTKNDYIDFGYLYMNSEMFNELNS